MYQKYLLCFLVLCLTIGVSVQAKGHGKKKDKSYITLIAAYSQRTIPGIPGAQVKTDYAFTIKWQGAKYPETFFWRGENGWLTCSIAKAHKIAGKGKEPKYRTEEVSADRVHKGDTLELRPITGGKFPISAEIPVDAKNTLYFRTEGKGWFSFPVKNIITKPDIMLQ